MDDREREYKAYMDDIVSDLSIKVGSTDWYKAVEIAEELRLGLRKVRPDGDSKRG